MEDFDFSGITDEQLAQAYDRAVQSNDFGNALLFKGELDRRRPQAAAPQTGMREQALSGIYEGLAAGAGAPVDIVASGLRRIGVPVGEAPIGGSESIRGLLQGITGGQAISEAEPQTLAQSAVRGGLRAVGEAAPAAAALPALGTRAVVTAAPTAWNAFKSLLGESAQAARTAPATYAATEAGVSAASGAAGATLSELFPENPSAQMVGEVLGALGGAGAARTAERLLTRLPAGPLTAADMKQAAGQMYDAQIAQGLSAQPTITRPMVDDMFQRLDMQGVILPSGRVDPEYGKTAGIFRILEQYADKGMTGANILRMRQAISGRLADAQGTEKNLLRNMLRQFDEYTGEVAPTIKTANALYARAMKADQLEEMMELAKIRAGQYSQSGMENAIRTEFRQLARRIVKGQELGWTPDEVQQIMQIAEGGTMENVARFVGKFAPRGVVSAGVTMGLPYSAAMQVTGDPYVSGAAALGVGAVGEAGSQVAAQLQQGNVDRLMKSILQGRNLSRPAEARLRAALTAYLGGQAMTGAAEAAQ